jgi:branched-chain amino acid transport system substrate-binding protein
MPLRRALLWGALPSALLRAVLWTACVVPAARAADPPYVKLGVLTDMAGVYSDATGAGSVIAVQMAAEDCLAAECRGMTVDVVSADHQNKPDVALAIARRWVDQDGVDALVDMSNAAIQLAAAPFAAEKHRVALFVGGTACLTGDACQPAYIVQWMWDTYAQVAGVARRLTQPGTTWFLVAADYAFGHQFEADAKTLVEAAGGRVLGSARHPFPSTDLSAYILQAQSSGADVVALANAGADTVNAIKTAQQLGLGADGRQRLVALYLSVLDVHGLGLQAAAGTVLSEGFYWDLDDGTRRFAQRFLARHGAMPSQIQAGLYSATLHYLRAVAAEGSTAAEPVIQRMHAMPIHDDVVRHARLRSDGRMVHDWYVFQVKTPAESHGPWDLYRLLDTVPSDEAFRPESAGGCPRLLPEGELDAPAR